MGAFGICGAFTCGMGDGAALGGGGIFGIGGGAAAGTLGIAGAAYFCPPAPAPGVEADPASASSGGRFRREMICVYGLGPGGASTGTGAGSPGGCMNAPVAPSPGNELCRGGAGLSAGIPGDGGMAGVGEVEVTTGAGAGATKTGSGSGATFIDGTEPPGAGEGGMTGPCIGGGALKVGCAGAMSLKIDVKLGSAAFTGAGDAGAVGAD